jgi:hypothetical protein
MLSNFVTIEPSTTVAALIDGYLLTSDQRTFPVLERGRLAGLVSLEDVGTVSRCQDQERAPAARRRRPAQLHPDVRGVEDWLSVREQRC